MQFESSFEEPPYVLFNAARRRSRERSSAKRGAILRARHEVCHARHGWSQAAQAASHASRYVADRILVRKSTISKPMLSAAEIDSVRLSLSIAARSVAVSLPLAVLFAWILARGRWRGKVLLDAPVHLPSVPPPVVVGSVLLLLFGARGPIRLWLDAV